jgi:AraC family transcriptional regulator
MNVLIKNLPEYHVAYIRHIGNYFEVKKIWEQLCEWAGKNQLFKKDTIMLGIGYDNPETTPTDKLRYDACITIDKNIKTPDFIKTMNLPGGKYAVYRFEDVAENIAASYHKLFAEWIPQNNHIVDDRPCFEIYYNNPDEHPEKKFIMDICISIK